MNDKYSGFTLVELLGVIILLAILVILVYPNVIERVQNKEKKLDEYKEKLLYTSTFDYLYDSAYSLEDGKCYCVAISKINKANKLYIDIDDNLLNNGFVQIQIGENGDIDQTKNAYRILQNGELCPVNCEKKSNLPNS